jgi:hypothetical protein
VTVTYNLYGGERERERSQVNSLASRELVCLGKGQVRVLCVVAQLLYLGSPGRGVCSNGGSTTAREHSRISTCSDPAVDRQSRTVHMAVLQHALYNGYSTLLEGRKQP